MDIQDWGAVGEIVGGVGVIITLLYLATQIRQNTKHIASASLQSMSERIENRMMAPINNTQFAETMAKARKGEDLTEIELIQVQNWLAVWISDLQDGYRQMTLGIVDEKVLRGRVITISMLLEWTSLYDHWQMLSTVADAEYIKWLENELQKLEST